MSAVRTIQVRWIHQNVSFQGHETTNNANWTENNYQLSLTFISGEKRQNTVPAFRTMQVGQIDHNISCWNHTKIRIWNHYTIYIVRIYLLARSSSSTTAWTWRRHQSGISTVGKPSTWIETHQLPELLACSPSPETYGLMENWHDKKDLSEFKKDDISPSPVCCQL